MPNDYRLMTISLVVAASNNNAIGKDNKLLWCLPNDMKFFKNVTWGMPVIMGRKTFEALGKPLKGRKNIVITRHGGWNVDGTVAVKSLDDAQLLVKEMDVKEMMVIGGGEIYKMAVMQFISMLQGRTAHFFSGHKSERFPQ